MRHSIYIVEDDSFIAEELKMLIESFGYSVSGVAHQEDKAIKELLKTPPSLACLDIDLGSGGSGFTVAKALQEHRIPFLFISSYFDEITLAQAKQYHPKGYIVKPFRDIDIKTNIALALGAASNTQSQPLPANELFVRKDGEIIKVEAQKILYLEGEDNYSKIHFADGTRVMSSVTLKKMEEKLRDFGFIRIHKSYLANSAYIRSINGNTLYIEQKALPIGKAFRSQLMDRITIL